MSKENRYVVVWESYVYADNDYMARKKAHEVLDAIEDVRNVQNTNVKEIGEQPFATPSFRKLDDISKPRDKDEDKELLF